MNKYIEKYKSMSVQARAALWFVACSFLQKGISFITVPIFTRLLSTDQYGTYSLYLSWLQILTIFTSLYLYNGVLDNAMAKFKDDRDRYISSMQGLTLVIWAIVCAALAVLYPVLKPILGLSPVFMLLMCAEMMFTPATYYWMGRQRFEYRYQRLVAFTILKSVLNPVLGIIFVLLTTEKDFARVLSVLLTTEKDFARVLSVVLVEVAFCGVVMAYQYFKGRTFYYADYWKYGIRLAIPMLPHYLAGMILNQGDRVMIDRMVGRSEVALYGVAYSVGMLAQIFVSAVNSAITPWLYAKVGSHKTDEIKKTSTFLVIAIAAVAMLLMLVSPEAIYLFGSSKYADAVYVIPPVAASVYFIFLYSLLSFPQFYFERTAFLMQASLIAAAANIALNYVFIGMFGYVAAGYTTLFCYILYAIGHFVVSRRVLRLENEGATSLVNTRAVVLVSVILILFTVVVNFVLGYRFVRYGMLLLLMIVGIVNRKKILYYIAAIRNRK